MTLKESNISIRSWAEEDRPREKLLLNGKCTLSDAELIAILIGTGTHRETAVTISKRIMSAVNYDLNTLGKLSVNEILELQIKGIGKVKAIAIVAALELARRRENTEIKKKLKIKSSEDVAKIFKPKMIDLDHEEFWILFVNRNNLILRSERISVGGLSGTVADIRMIFKIAITNLATSIIAGHNHPSGSLKPSGSDIELTRKLADGGKILDITLLDHIIISENGYYSFADEGML